MRCSTRAKGAESMAEWGAATANLDTGTKPGRRLEPEDQTTPETAVNFPLLARNTCTTQATILVSSTSTMPPG